VSLPDRSGLPVYLAPLPQPIEDLCLKLAWPIVAVNLLGTAFGFWYYRFQLSVTPWQLWPIVPDSPTATLFIALSIAAWKLEVGRWAAPIHALAVVGCIKLGAWTPYVLVVFADGFAASGQALYTFMFFSHLLMVAQAFLVQRYASIPVWAAGIGVGWYLLNDVFDYFIPVLGVRTHTFIPPETAIGSTTEVTHVSPAHEYAAVGAIVLTVVATFVLLATRVKQLEQPTTETLE